VNVEGGAAEAHRHRVSFGSGYVQSSLLACFLKNLEHYPLLLPMVVPDGTASLAHLRLHNGTI
jgi:hypothetical protein